MKKKDVIALLHEMPEDIDVDDLIYKLYLKQKIEAAELAAGTGDLISHDEAVRRSEEWLK